MRREKVRREEWGGVRPQMTGEGQNEGDPKEGMEGVRKRGRGGRGGKTSGGGEGAGGGGGGTGEAV